LALGRALRRAGVYQAALNELRRGMMLRDGRKGEVAVALRHEVALTLVDQGDFNGARRACADIGLLSEGKAMQHACLAEAHMIRKRASDALPEVESALALSPGLYEARVVEGYAKWMTGQEAEAEQILLAAGAAEKSRTEAWIALGRLRAATGRGAQSVEAFEKAVAADGSDPEASLALARALPASERAVALLESSIRGKPTSGPAHARLGEVLFELGRIEQAESEVRLALRSGAVDADWHALLAELLVKRGQADAALASAADALRLVPNSARAKLAQADAYAAKKDIDLAIEAYQSAFSFGRSQPTALVRAARACLDNQRETTARGFAERSTEAFPSWGPGWEVTGDIAVKSGENELAKRAYQRALAAQGPVDRARVRAALAKLP
jgi:tetratricopeptide (TPR) repeat protein